MIDDSVLDISVTEHMIDKGMYEFYIAKSGREALKHLSGGFFPDLILLDIIMPEMDGWETFSRIKDLGLISNIPIAFLTSAHGAEEQNHAKEIGAADYILKPYTREVLLKRIGIILKKYPVRK